MLSATMHNHTLRILVALTGTFLSAVALNLFIVPQGLYTGGLLGLCQIVRTLLQTAGGMDFGTMDIAGIFYFLLNIPILLFAYRTLGQRLVVRTLICTVAYSLFYSVIPIPTEPLVEDALSSCLLGGILNGIGSGIVLTCGCSMGGLDVVGLCLAKRGIRTSVGRFSLLFNGALYTSCLFLFDASTAIYSVIYTAVSSVALDRMHQQNVAVQALIFTRSDEKTLANFIIARLNRSVTYWDGIGAFNGDGLHVLCVCLSKYEIDELLRIVRENDSHAFVTIAEGIHIVGNFPKKLDG